MLKVKKSQLVDRKAVQMPGAQEVFIRRLITREDGAPTFAMRLFEVAPGGHTPRHQHVHEHEVFILDGKGEVMGAQGAMPLEAGTAVLVPSDEEHQFRNVGSEPLVFLCLVPTAADA